MKIETLLDILAVCGVSMLATGVYMEFGVAKMLIVIGTLVLASAVAAARRG